MRLLRVTYPKQRSRKPAREFLSLLGPFDPRCYRKPRAASKPMPAPADEAHRVADVCAWLEEAE